MRFGCEGAQGLDRSQTAQDQPFTQCQKEQRQKGNRTESRRDPAEHRVSRNEPFNKGKAPNADRKRNEQSQRCREE